MSHDPDISRGPITKVGVLSEAEADNDEEEKVRGRHHRGRERLAVPLGEIIPLLGEP